MIHHHHHETPKLNAGLGIGMHKAYFQSALRQVLHATHIIVFFS